MTTHSKIVDSLVFCLSRLGLPTLMRQFQNHEFCILKFQGVTEEERHRGLGNAGGSHIHLDDLEEIFALLRENYEVISLERALKCIRYREPLPSRSVVLTFDDGYRSIYDLAFPLLKEYELPATLFLPTDFIENRAWLWWDRLEYAIGNTLEEEIDYSVDGQSGELRLNTMERRFVAYQAMRAFFMNLPQEEISTKVGELEDYLECSLDSADRAPSIYRPLRWAQVREMLSSPLIHVGGHTHTHCILGRCDAATVQNELFTSADILRDQLDIADALFAYPNGERGDCTQDTRRQILEAGFRCALTTEPGFNRLTDDPFALKRFTAGKSSRAVDFTASGSVRYLLAIDSLMRRRAA